MSEVDKKKIAEFHKACELFGIGESARGISGVLLTNIENCKSKSDKLLAIENAFFTVESCGDGDSPHELALDFECLVNSWSTTTQQYVEQFRSALKKIQSDEITRLKERVEELEKTRAEIRQEVYNEIGAAQSNAYENKYFEAGEDLEVLLDHLQTNEKVRIEAHSKE